MDDRKIILLIAFIFIIMIIVVALFVYNKVGNNSPENNKELQIEQMRVIDNIVKTKIPKECSGYLIEIGKITLNCDSLDGKKKKYLREMILNEISKKTPPGIVLEIYFD